MSDQNAKLPIFFWVVAVVGLIWNLLGVMNFFGQTFMSEETMAALPQEQQALFEAVPSWMTVIFAIAVFSGTLGCLGLLLKKAWAVPLFLASLLAVVVQVSYNLFVINIGSVLGPMTVVVTILILVIGVFLYFYSKQAKTKGWIR